MNQNKFNWKSTKRDIVIFVPNYGRKKLLEVMLQRFETTTPEDKWIFLVVNDGLHEDLSDLEKYNLKWFTFTRKDKSTRTRNGCMIRNYVLKRLQCNNLVITDPEIFIDNKRYLDIVLENKDKLVTIREYFKLRAISTNMLLHNSQTSLELLHKESSKCIVDEKSIAFHAWSSIPVKTIRDMRGYDEDFSYDFAHEDVDVLGRLLQSGLSHYVSNTCAFHINHFLDAKLIHTGYDRNKLIFNDKSKKDIVRNNNGWGEG